MKPRLFVVVIAGVVVLGAGTAGGATISVSGDVGGQTWTAGNTYYLVFDAQVPQDSTLTVQAGAVVKVGAGRNLQVYGTLDVNGSSGSEAVFTSMHDDTAGEVIGGSSGSPAPGDWGRILVQGTGDFQGVAEIDHAIVRYGGMFGQGNINFHEAFGWFNNSTSELGSSFGLRCYRSAPTIDGSTFASNSSHGVYAINTGALPMITNSTFTNNGSYGAYLDGGNPVNYSGNTGAGNVVNGFGLDGTVVAGATWSAPSSTFPFVLVNRVTVDVGATLTIEPGTILKVADGAWLEVNGSLDVNGSFGDEVVFTSFADDAFGGDTDGVVASPAPGQWRGIEIEGGDAQIDSAIVRYGGSEFGNLYFRNSTGWANSTLVEYSDTSGIFSRNSSVTVDGCTLANNNEFGLLAQGANSSPTVTNNTFTSNGLGSFNFAAYMDGVILTSFSGNTGTGNWANAFAVWGSVSNGTVWSMPTPAFPFVMYGDVTVEIGSTLQLDPGTIVKVDATYALEVDGTLEADGTEASPVVITSLTDDKFGGDTLGDGGSPSAGDWGSIDIYGIGNFDNCLLRYGGDSSWQANIRYIQSTSGTISNCVVEHSGEYGVYVYNSSPVIRSTAVRNNTSYGVFISGTSAPDLGQNGPRSGWGQNSFSGNDSGQYQVYNDTDNPIDAYYNDWDAEYFTEAAIDPHIYDDDENPSSGAVGFIPQAGIFKDTFETGDTIMWSRSVP